MSETRSKSSRSVIWQYFQTVDAKNVKCSICESLFRNNSNTNNLIEHLKRRHKPTYNNIIDSLKSESNTEDNFEEASEIPMAIENIKFEREEMVGDETMNDVTDIKLSDNTEGTIINEGEILIQQTNESNAEIELNENTDEIAKGEYITLNENSEFQIVKIVPLPHARSEVWTYFGFVANDEGQILDKTKVVCKICASTFCYSGNTTNFYSHLKSMHSEIQIRATPYKTNKSIKRAYTSISNTDDGENIDFSDTSANCYNINNTIANDDSFPARSRDDLIYVEDITQTIVDFLVTDCRPLCIVQGKGFQRLLRFLAPNYVLPDKQKLALAIRKKYDEIQKDKESYLDKFGTNNYP